MSHYSVLVVTPEKPTEDQLQEVLLPWHEYECTGIERYLEWVDETPDVEKCYKKYAEEGQSFEEYANNEGYKELPDKPGRYGRLTNPNRKWDWYCVGGWWSNKLFSDKLIVSEGVNQLPASDIKYSSIPQMFALVLPDPQATNGYAWYDKGKMGSFGCVSDEHDDWDITYRQLLRKIKPTDYLTVVDCHI